MTFQEGIKESKKNILKVANLKNKGHLPSAFSIINLIYTFYDQQMNVSNDFVLSKGHGCLALYSVLEHFGYITKDQFFSFGDFDSILGGHPHIKKHKEIKASTGSLGHGLPISAGKALAAKIDGSAKRIYCLIGDGEANEGTTWESALLAAHLQLTNLVCIVDNNRSQERSLPTPSIEKKFDAFGWEVMTIDGHNSLDIKKILAVKDNSRPLCVVMNTIKGKGVHDMEDNTFEWHHKGVSEALLQKYLIEIDEEAIS